MAMIYMCGLFILSKTNAQDIHTEVDFVNKTENSIGMYVKANAAANPPAMLKLIGLKASTNAQNGIAVLGVATGGTATGVFGDAPNVGVFGRGFRGVWGSDDVMSGASRAGYFSGDVETTGSFLGTISDRRLKRNLKPMEAVSDHLAKVNVYNYEYKKEFSKEYNLSSGEQLGFVAQELQEIYPHLVHESMINYDRHGNKMDTDYLTINYMGMIPILTQALKEQRSVSKSQADVIRQLRQELSTIKEELKRIAVQLKEDPKHDN